MQGRPGFIHHVNISCGHEVHVEGEGGAGFSQVECLLVREPSPLSEF